MWNFENTYTVKMIHVTMLQGEESLMKLRQREKQHDAEGIRPQPADGQSPGPQESDAAGMHCWSVRCDSQQLQ